MSSVNLDDRNSSGAFVKMEPEERTQLWDARHNAYFACLQLRPGSRAVSTDVCVPLSRLAECVHETMEDMKGYFAPVPLLGHIGDGNFHLMLFVDPTKPEETEIAKKFNKKVVERALSMEGTCTGEHGVGLGKIGSMTQELGEDVVSIIVPGIRFPPSTRSAYRIVPSAVDRQIVLRPVVFRIRASPVSQSAPRSPATRMAAARRLAR